MAVDLRDIARGAKRFVADRSKTFWIALGIFLAIFIAIGVTNYVRARQRWKRYVECGSCLLRFKNRIINLAGQRPLSSRLLPAPKAGNDFTYTMWLYVADWYTHYNKWKSVFCKSPTFPTGCSSLAWNMVGEQCPGIWMADKVNNMRFVVQTNVSVPTTCLYGDLSSSSSSGKSEKGKSVEQSSDLTNCIRENQGYPTEQTPMLEYADLEDFPIGRWFHITLIVREGVLELYRDAKLVSTTTLIGTPNMNMGMGRFGAINPFSGRMAYFRYMDVAVPLPVLREMYGYEKIQSFHRDPDPMQEDVAA